MNSVKSWKSMAALMGGMGLLLAGCGQQQAEADRQPGATPGMTQQDTAAQMPQERERMLTQWQIQLDTLGQRIDNLENQLQQAPEQTQAAVRPSVDTLQQRASELGNRIEQAEDYSVEQWQAFQNEVDTTLTVLQRDLDQVRGRI